MWKFWSFKLEKISLVHNKGLALGSSQSKIATE